jgi:hypothetical protein
LKPEKPASICTTKNTGLIIQKKEEFILPQKTGFNLQKLVYQAKEESNLPENSNHSAIFY